MADRLKGDTWLRATVHDNHFTFIRYITMLHSQERVTPQVTPSSNGGDVFAPRMFSYRLYTRVHIGLRDIDGGTT